jgi:predicted porin
LAATLSLALPVLAAAQAPAVQPAPETPAAAPAPAAPAAEPAKAAIPLATIYGTLNVNFQTTRAGGATNPAQNVEARNSVSTDSSNIGVRGGLAVRDWVQVVYQCETSANVDGISVSGICNRNSRVGLSGGDWGTLFYGNWDTPFKAVAYGTKADDPFMNTDVFGFQSILSSPGFNYRSGGWSTASNTSTIGFDVRANNTVAYHSPKWGGFSMKFQYSANEFKNASGSQNPELFGSAFNFDYGPFSLLAAFERHDDGFALPGINTATAPAFGATAANTAAVSSNDLAWRLGAGVQIDSAAGATTLSGMFEQLTLKQDHAPTGAIKEYKRNAWQAALKHRMGDHELRARYSQADAGDVTLNGGGGSTSGYGAKDIALGYAYHLAKSAQIYLYYSKIINQANAQYTFTIGGSPAVAGSTPKGADPQALGLGVRYAF